MVVFRKCSEVWHHAVYSGTVKEISVQIQLDPFGIPARVARVRENAHPVTSDFNVHTPVRDLPGMTTGANTLLLSCRPRNIVGRSCNPVDQGRGNDPRTSVIRVSRWSGLAQS